jgi:sucrose-6-phosphatase
MKFLLVTDLDHTLVGDHPATLSLNQRLSIQRQQICLVYATGRSLNSFRDLCTEFTAATGSPLLIPDYLIAGVGSEIYDSNQRDPVWAEQLSQNWQRQPIADLAARIPGLAPQPITEQNPWKLSFFVSPNPKQKLPPIEHLAHPVNQLQRHLRDQDLAAEIIFSSNRDLDILPSGTNKGTAMTYLRTQLQISAAQTLVCGDSGNDIALFSQPSLGVIVSNAQPELLDWHRQFGQPQHYLAKAAHAAGIAEALDYFKLIC